MKLLIILIPAVALSGCASLFPIKTKVKVRTPDGVVFSYSSSKDIEAKKTILDDEGNPTETLSIKSNASDPATAQAEIKRVEAETLNKAMEVINNKLP